MELKNFLISIGRLKAEDEPDTTNKSDELDAIKEMQTVGEIFDLLKGRYKQVPANFQINVPGWPANNYRH